MEIDYSIQYDKWHDDSPEHYAEMAEFYRRLLAPLLPELQPSSLILDVGCGTGLLVNALLRLGYQHVVGVDLSEHQVSRAVSRGLPCTVVDPEELNRRVLAQPASLDAVFLMDVLEHIPVPQQIPFLRTLCQLLKPGGLLVMSVPNASSSFAARMVWIDWQHVGAFSEHSLEFVARNAGFSSLQLYPYEFGASRRFPYVHQAGFWTGLVRRAFRALRRLEAIGEFGRQGLRIPLGLNLLAACKRPR